MKKKGRITALFVVYGILLLWAILFKFNYDRLLKIDFHQQLPLYYRLTKYLIPFKSTEFFIRQRNWIEISAFFLNFVLLMPLGALLSFYMPKNPAVVICIVFPFVIELVQVFSYLGGLDTTDIIMNSLGGITGVTLYHWLRPGMKDETVDLICMFALCGFGPMALYALTETLLALPRHIMYILN